MQMAMQIKNYMVEHGIRFLDQRVPVKVELGAEDTLKGWNEGLVGMCVGERRTLTVPAFMGYGSKRHGEVPPNSALQYFIELVELSGGTAAPKRAPGDEKKGGFKKPEL